MIARASAYVVALLLVGACAMPSAALATSGGVAIPQAPATPAAAGAPPAGGTSGPQPAGTVGVVQPGNATVTAAGDGVTIASEASGLLRGELSFTGSVSPSAAGRVVEIERLGAQTSWTWTATAHATVGAGGSFTVVWRANHIGRFQFRPVLDATTASHAAGAPPAITVTVYRPSIATQYGPGFYGNTTACGIKLKRATLGVANRTLRCGTLVAIYYSGHTMVVPVIDRGPYANGADWDLTEASGRALGIPGTATIGAVSLPSAS